MSQWSNIRSLPSSNSNVWKYVFEKDNAIAESVLYRYPDFNTRTVICCSTQSGCPVGCRFCGSGDYFIRSLSSEEIASQPEQLLKDIEEKHGVKTSDINRLQIMFMSMGEPFLNLKNLIPALASLNEKFPTAALLVSTSAPKSNYELFREVSQKISKIGLQFSIHESTDEAREKLIPFKAKLTLKEIAQEGIEWAYATGRQPFFNYCAHENNTSEADADRLLSLFIPQIWQATISVICEREEHVSAANERQRNLAASFRQKLSERGFQTRMFDPAGQDDIGGGCGQLWFVQEWIKQHPDLSRKSSGFGLPIIHTPGK